MTEITIDNIMTLLCDTAWIMTDYLQVFYQDV